MDPCQICFEAYTKQAHRKPVECTYCQTVACTRCIQRYLESSYEDAHCFGCKHGWTYDFLESNFPKTWYNGEFKRKREEILMDRERSRLPLSQQWAENIRVAETTLKPKIDAINARMRELTSQIYELESERRSLYHEHYVIKDSYDRLMDHDPDRTRAEDEDRNKDKKVFTMHCPADGCRGFLSTQYKCGLCNSQTCSKCLILIVEDEGVHECKGEDVESVALIKKDCRNCPKCSMAIYRIEGCYQMFCTACNTPFDWGTGREIVNEAIHNPHYNDYLRLNPDVARRPGGRGGNIGCDFDIGEFRTVMENHMLSKNFIVIPYESHLWKLHRIVLHMRRVELDEVVEKLNDQNTKLLNAHYLLGEMTDEEWKKKLLKIEFMRLSMTELRQAIEAYVNLSTDILRNFVDELRTEYDAAIHDNRINAIREIVNTIVKKYMDQLKEMINIYNAKCETLMKIYKGTYPVIVFTAHDRWNQPFNQYETVKRSLGSKK